MNKLQEGISTAIVAIVVGIVTTQIIASFVKDGLLPVYFAWLIMMAMLAGNLATFRDKRVFGTAFTIGWLIGGMLLREILDPMGIIIYIVAPIIVLVLRVVQFKKSLS